MPRTHARASPGIIRILGISWFIGMALCAACGEAPSKAAANSTSARVYEVQGCSTCHGPAGEGTILGPTLRGIQGHWTRDTLIEFLVDPRAYAAKVPRLAEQERRYMQPMQQYAALSAEQRGALADYVLSMR